MAGDMDHGKLRKTTYHLEQSPMFLKRIVISLFFKKAPTHDASAQARMMLRRLQELLEMTPALPIAASSADSNAGAGDGRV